MSDVYTETRPLLHKGKEKLIELFRERINLYKRYSHIEIVNDDCLEKN